jgi:predicted XRE-type DNA-binding protein
MRLGDWMKSNCVKQVQLSVMAGVGQPHISDFLNGKKGFGKHNAARIVAVTKGKVKLEELLFPEKQD